MQKKRTTLGFSFVGILFLTCAVGVSGLAMLPVVTSHARHMSKQDATSQLQEFARRVREYKAQHGIFPDSPATLGMGNEVTGLKLVYYGAGFPKYDSKGQLLTSEGAQDRAAAWQEYLGATDWTQHPIAMSIANPHPDDVDFWQNGQPGFIEGGQERFLVGFLNGEVKYLDQNDPAHNAWTEQTSSWQQEHWNHR